MEGIEEIWKRGTGEAPSKLRPLQVEEALGSALFPTLRMRRREVAILAQRR